ncbi:DM13 domain-containing protein [Actinophytocola sp. NPDC049390]|uniref:DM13 domain-containing protein n=1 Tax=Actinophytocola sp. NPDC049390 TaxID=3363894 RepID=UPI0037AD4A5E
MRRLLIWVGVPVALIGLGVGLALFEPWRAFTSSHLDEPAPVAVAKSTAPEVLAEGAFVSQEHDTSGTARVLELPDGSRVLRLEGFSTSDGPDVHVWLSAATAGGDWHSYDDGRYVALGEIKATDGNHNYAIPAGADLTGLRSAVIWCDRFNVAFGSAALAL